MRPPRPIRAPLPAPVAALAVPALVAASLTCPGSCAIGIWTLIDDPTPYRALAIAMLVGTIVMLTAEAWRQRDCRPALHAAIAIALLAGPLLAIPLAPVLIAAAALIGLPRARPPRAANDNQPMASWSGNPFALAA